MSVTIKTVTTEPQPSKSQNNQLAPCGPEQKKKKKKKEKEKKKKKKKRKKERRGGWRIT